MPLNLKTSQRDGVRVHFASTHGQREATFFAKASEIHGNLYDYSEATYVNYDTKINIRCSQHGIFSKTPSNHITLRQGCPACKIDLDLSLRRAQFLQKCHNIWSGAYQYHENTYVNGRSPVEIICKHHGPFWQKVGVHLAGSGCPKCAIAKGRSSHDSFVTKANDRWVGRYSYGKVRYIDSQTPVTVICPEHGPFSTRPAGHLCGHGCPECADGTASRASLQQRFARKVRAAWGERYDLSLVNYRNGKTPVVIICRKHGPFVIHPQNLLRGHGCYGCAITGPYNQTFFTTHPSVANKPGFFYCVKFSGIGQTFYKVGIASHPKRAKQHMSDVPYTVTVVKLTVMPTLYQAWQKEQAFLSYVHAANLKYYPPIKLRWGGDTECFIPMRGQDA